MRLYVMGSSTTTDDYPAAALFPWQGWGYRLNEYFTSEVTVVNLAISGWSMKGMVNTQYVPFTEMLAIDQKKLHAPEKSPWAYLMQALREDDWVLLGSTSANEKYRTDIEGWSESPKEYKELLIKCCKEILQKGAHPLLLSGTGPFLPGGNGLEEYEAVKSQVAEEVGQGVLFFNINERLFDKFREMVRQGQSYDDIYTRYYRTQETMRNYYQKYHYLGTELAKYFKDESSAMVPDKGHYCIEGALEYSGMFMDMLLQSDCPLKQYVKCPRLDMEACIHRDIKCIASWLALE